MSHGAKELMELYLMARRLGLSSAEHYLEQAFQLYLSEHGASSSAAAFNHCAGAA